MRPTLQHPFPAHKVTRVSYTRNSSENQHKIQGAQHRIPACEYVCVCLRIHIRLYRIFINYNDLCLYRSIFLFPLASLLKKSKTPDWFLIAHKLWLRALKLRNEWSNKQRQRHIREIFCAFGFSCGRQCCVVEITQSLEWKGPLLKGWLPCCGSGRSSEPVSLSKNRLSRLSLHDPHQGGKHDALSLLWGSPSTLRNCYLYYYFAS